MHVLNLSVQSNGPREEQVVVASPNKPMQRAGTDKVLGRGRVNVVLEQVLRARVLRRRRAVADGRRSAPLLHGF
jgi:hypothetical protein